MASKRYFVRFTVEGSGIFPLDMLRYDRCYPRSENDANTAQDGRVRRQVELLAPNRAEAYWQPTAGRWESFGWKVLKWERVSYSDGA
jgi:hypothetical protein